MSHSTSDISHEALQEIVRALSEIRFGSLEITVHDGRVTQIERREKKRFTPTETTKNQPTARAAAYIQA